MDTRLVDEVQALVDQLAERVRRSVAVDDPSGNLIAVSRHFGDADPYRMRLVLDRRIPQGLRAYFARFTRDADAEPFRVPGNADLSVAPRICFPIRYHDENLAFLWLMDLEPSAPADVVRSYCGRLAEILITRRRPVATVDDGPAGATVERLLAGRQATLPPEDIDGDPAIADRIVIAHHNATDQSASTEAAGVLRAAAGNAAHIGVSLSCIAELEGCTVAAFRLAGPQDAGEDDRVGWLADEVKRLAGPADLGSGYGCSSLKTIGAVRVGFAEAALAAFVGAQLHRTQSVLTWPQVRATAGTLTTPDLDDAPWSAALHRMLLDTDGSAFETVGALLHSGRGINAADVLHVHRTTLHYRLQQITEATGLDLAAPADRYLVFGVWLRAALLRSPIAALVTSAEWSAMSAERSP